MVLDESRTAGESGHLSDHNSLHDFYNAAVDAGAFDEATGTYKDTSFEDFPPASLDPVQHAGNEVWDVANRGWYYRSLPGRAGSFSSVQFFVGTSSGNISVAAYTNSGSGTAALPTGGQKATSGAVACPASGNASVSLGTTVTFAQGDWLAMSCDNTTATFLSNNSVSAGGKDIFKGRAHYQSTAHPLPATPSAATTLGSRIFVLQGVTS